jgi:hypothetical protein
MRHGFLQEVRSVASGTLPGGLDNSRLAQVDYAYEGTDDIERSHFTLVLTEAAASAGFVVRVLCHDRGLAERDRANPDSDRQVVKLDDTAVRLESDALLERYAISTDHDQDQLAVWQLFDPSLIDWLTAAAPAGFSFELQDGALCCFVPGTVADPDALDALCAAAARVFARVLAIDGDAGTAGGAGGGSAGERTGTDDAPAPRPGTRDELVERELAEHPFASPPKRTKDAAKAFRRGLALGDRAWALGAEAFFRSYAVAAGFEPIASSAYRAGHIDTFLPGVLAHAARGHLADGTVEAFLVLTDDESYDDMGWSNLVVELGSPMQGMALAANFPQGARDERGAIRAGSDARSLILTALDGGDRDRTAAEIDALFAAAERLLAGP